MRSRSTAILSVLAVSGLLLAGCASGSKPSETTSASDLAIVESTVADPAAVGERVGADGVLLEVWSGAVPDETIGEADEGNQWVTANVAQWVTEEGVTAADVAPVVRSTADDSFSAEGEARQNVDIELVPNRSYTFVWSYQVPEELVDPASLVLCVGDGDEGCSRLTD
ncbi:hypothetical protein [Microbacterium immunditiarum]|uniref:Lipoprotein n=1 Tax=Microbacterium immunditiarum TaxID=337480 RepID=A0A7Y9GMF9_9MICO|nr:hypothetical protein [Microbacterium immunditiarum]NYE19202.1 hypothetical protein [Microbacterium immunditiarum]